MKYKQYNIWLADLNPTADQPRAIDNKRFIKKLGRLTSEQTLLLKENLKIILDL